MYCVDFAAEGFKVFAEREVPCELRSDAGRLSSDAGSVEAIRVRILVRGSPPELEAVRVGTSCQPYRQHKSFHYTLGQANG